jgi:hypothetical protein
MQSPVAERALIAESKVGARFDIHLRIGIPIHAPDDSWICAAGIEGLISRSLDTRGADSLQALLLALWTVRGQLDDFVKDGGKLYLPGDEAGGPMTVAEIFSQCV